jgi:putative endonuclease
MHFFYIIYSESLDTFYIGETYNVVERVLKHNSHTYENSFTKIASDWKLVLSYELTSRDEAIFVEKFVKRMKSKVFINKIIAKPEIVADILSKRD